MNNNIENMAREYQATLKNASNNYSVDDYERIITLTENQIDILSSINCRNNNAYLRRISYLKSLCFRTLYIVSNLAGKTSYVPSFRNYRADINNAKNRLLDIQISIFVILDGINVSYSTLSELISYENRKLSLINTL